MKLLASFIRISMFRLFNRCSNNFYEVKFIYEIFIFTFSLKYLNALNNIHNNETINKSRVPGSNIQVDRGFSKTEIWYNL